MLHPAVDDVIDVQLLQPTAATHEQVSKLFSPTIADLVEGVSKLTRIQYATKEDEQMENLRKMLIAMSKDIRVILIKISDRLHNMRTMEYQTAEKQRQKSLETMEIYAPIAHRLGMQRIKWELEDLSLKYLDPVGYDEITRSLEAKQSEHEAFMERVQAQIEERLKEQHVPYLKVYGLCVRSANLMRMTRMSLAIAMSILRRFSICSSSLETYCTRVSLVTPSTSSATDS